MSRWFVGSSRRSTSGWRTSARASSVCRFRPPEADGERHVGVEAEVRQHRVDARLQLPRVGGIERVVQAVELAKRGVAAVRARRGGWRRGSARAAAPRRRAPRRRRRRSCPSTSSGTSCSSRVTVVPVWRTTSPVSGLIVPSSSLMSVLFPAPFRPSRQTRSPRSMLNAAPIEHRRATERDADILHSQQSHGVR